jgi:molybdate transport system ATP-binding protein
VCKRLSPSFTLDVAFSASAGITMLFGASGSGKTTLLRCLAGLLTPDEGRIEIDGETFFRSDTGRDEPVRTRNIGYVFQQLALFPHLSVGDNIQYGLQHRAVEDPASRARAIAESFRIAHLWDRKPPAISGGERQRVALARALVVDPTLLLLDEPLSALDHATQSRIIEDLRRWNSAHQIPIIYVTHSHREVFALGERVLALDQGRLVADGTPHEVMESPSHDAIAQIAGFENFFDGSVVASRSDAGTMTCRLSRPGPPDPAASGPGPSDLAEAAGGLELEVPLANVRVGAPIRVAVRAGDILLATEEPRRLSARNVFAGSIFALRREGALIVADVDAGEVFVVHLTPGAVEALRLAPGVRVWLIIKTHSFRIVSL